LWVLSLSHATTRQIESPTLFHYTEIGYIDINDFVIPNEYEREI